MSIPVEKTLDEIRTDLFGRVATVQQDGWLPEWLNLNRGPIRGLIELWAWGLFQLYSFLAVVLKQAFPNTSTGAWLDLHCAQVAVERKESTKAKGQVKFSRTDTTGNVIIPEGRVVKTKPDGTGNVYRYVTLAEAILPDGQAEIYVDVEAEEYGTGANATAGQITEISTVINGIDAVTNESGWLESEGADAETDDDLRARYFLRWQDINGATKYAYESWAMSITGVIAVTILDQHPRGQGTVDVVIKGAAGIPTQDLIDAVDAKVQANRPINDDVLVKSPTAVDIDITAELELVSGTAAAILTEAENRIRAIFTDPATVTGISPIQIGEDLTMDRLIAAVMAVSGVKKINWTSPAADVVAAEDGLAVLNSLALTTVWASEA
jgi:uncharacterized phage protein gp47/JayE